MTWVQPRKLSQGKGKSIIYLYYWSIAFHLFPKVYMEATAPQVLDTMRPPYRMASRPTVEERSRRARRRVLQHGTERRRKMHCDHHVTERTRTGEEACQLIEMRHSSSSHQGGGGHRDIVRPLHDASHSQSYTSIIICQASYISSKPCKNVALLLQFIYVMSRSAYMCSLTSLLPFFCLDLCLPIKVLFSCEIFLYFAIVALSFLFDKHCPIME